MATLATDTDVLIVGAGPVGLFLGNECARRGVRWKLIEERSSQSVHSKALAIFPRTLEIFDMAGLVAPFLQEANRVTAVAVITHGHRLAQMRFAPHESAYSFIAMVPQNVTEDLLLKALQNRAGNVEYETKFLSSSQEADHVNVTVERKGERMNFTARFVVGCDGAHSTVRHGLGLTLEGGEYHDSFMLADIETNDALPGNELQLCPSELGPVAIFPMSAERRRIVATIKEPQGEAPSLELVRKILRDRAPAGIEARGLHWSSYFRIHHRNVAHLRVGRVFLAGDAAHIHSPFGGQGMNTGLHDAWNLVWKLDLFLRGHGNESLLDSYEAERLPVIKSVIHTTDTLTKVMGTPNKFVQLLRDAFIPMFSRLAPFQHAFVQRLSELGIGYRGSPIVEGPGMRYFDDGIRGGDGIRSRFLLLLTADAACTEPARQLFESFESVLERRISVRSGVMLVRPDGYVAFSSDHSNRSELESVRSLLQKQVTQVERTRGAS
jgi:2-polyprenyl-6-methoxyphenol hydroxylase-like FAD-dependent oxidoreductase